MKRIVLAAMAFISALIMGCSTKLGPSDILPTIPPTATATAIATATSTPTATLTLTYTATSLPTATATNTATIAIQSYDSSLGGWQTSSPIYNAGEQGLTNPVWNATEGHNAAGSAACSGNYDASVNPAHRVGDFIMEPSPSLNLVGKTMSVWIKVPQAMADSGAYQATLFMQDTMHHWMYGGITPLNTAGWVQISVAVSDMATGNLNDPSITYKIGIRIEKLPAYASDVTKDVTGVTIYFDDFNY
ncbi:MAG: hypothetical protein WCJ94_02360 [bacterium]